MSKLFEGRQAYAGKWSLKSTEAMNPEEKAQVKEAKVVAGDYGLSCCFTMISGVSYYVGMSNDADVQEGDILDVDKIKVLTLSRAGSDDIQKIGY